jgi:hypothetical protein
VHHRRPWLLATFGAAAATAAVVAGIAVLGGDGSPGADRDPAAPPATATSPAPTDPSPTDASPTPTDGTSAETVAVPVYLVGDTPQGSRLYREFRQVPSGDSSERLLASGNLALGGEALDPDYRTLWPAGAELAAAADVRVGSSEAIRVELGSPALVERPAGMGDDEARLAIQQLVYTLQGVVGDRLPLQFRVDDAPVDRVLGVPVSTKVTNAPQVDVLALVNITEPGQGAVVSGRLLATGVANSFEATVPLEVRRGDEVVLQDFTTAEGWGERLYPWTKTLDVSALPAGDYTLVAMTDDPSGGEGGGPQVDTREFTIAD